MDFSEYRFWSVLLSSYTILILIGNKKKLYQHFLYSTLSFNKLLVRLFNLNVCILFFISIRLSVFRCSSAFVMVLLIDYLLENDLSLFLLLCLWSSYLCCCHIIHICVISCLRVSTTVYHIFSFKHFLCFCCVGSKYMSLFSLCFFCDSLFCYIFVLPYCSIQVSRNSALFCLKLSMAR